jgi:membrane protease YdiL (CAAX protease family)
MSITVFRFVYRSVFVVNLFLLATLLPFSGRAMDQGGAFFAQAAILYSFLCFGFSLIAPLIVFASWAMIWVTCEKGRFFVPELGWVICCLLATSVCGFVGLPVALTWYEGDPLGGIIGVLVLSVLAFIAAVIESPFGFLWSEFQKKPLQDEEKTSSNQDVPLTDTQQG